MLASFTAASPVFCCLVGLEKQEWQKKRGRPGNKASKMELFIQGHSQVSTVLSKGFYNSIQWEAVTDIQNCIVVLRLSLLGSLQQPFLLLLPNVAINDSRGI